MGVRLLRARSSHHRGKRLWHAGHHQTACARQDQAIRLFPREELDRPARVMELVAIIRTRAAYACTLTDHGTAETMYLEAVALLAIIAADPRRDEALTRCLIGLGNTHRLQGRYEWAAERLRIARDIAKRPRLDPRLRAAVAGALGNLATDTGRYDEAARHYATALAVLEMTDQSDRHMRAAVQRDIDALAQVQTGHGDGESPT